jgi:hypothetical protein
MQATDAKGIKYFVSKRSMLLVSALLIGFSIGCAPPSPSQKEGGETATGSASSGVPELDDATINERINHTYVRDVPEETGVAQPISWGFDEHEPKEIVVVEKQVDGTRAEIVLDIKTRSAPRARNQRQLAGRIRTEWRLTTGWVLRRWEIVDTENISMKYKDILASPSPQNTNR